MQRIPLILSGVLFFLLSAGALNGQETVFAYGYSGKASTTSPPTVKGYKYEVTYSVFQALVQARGDHRKTTPSLVMNKGRQYIAWMNPEKLEVGVEEKAYDVCTQFGGDSLKVLATLLAHELIHYYENHDWSRHFVSENKKLEASKKIGALEEGIKFETQADYLGGILAISAGYDAYHLMSGFLQEAYRAYGFKEEIPGYPSLKERITLSDNTAAKLKEVHAVYQTANMLMLVDAFEPALNYYDFILREYQSYEVYNNAGVCAALAVLDLMRPEEMPFALPLEIDPSSRLDELATRLPEDVEERKAVLLAKAQQFLDNAVSLTDNNASSSLNLAIVALLEGEWLDAGYLASKARRTAKKQQQPKTEGDALLVQGIVAALEGEKEEAARFFERAQALSPYLATVNLNLLRSEQQEVERNPTQNFIGVEKVGPISLDDFLEYPELDRTIEITKTVYCGDKDSRYSTLQMHYADDGDTYAVFQTVRPNYSGQTKQGISLGARINDVKKLYLEPDKTLILRSGTCLRYDDAQLLFFFNDRDRLMKWTIFRSGL